jgi:hypothetical protein
VLCVQLWELLVGVLRFFELKSLSKSSSSNFDSAWTNKDASGIVVILDQEVVDEMFEVYYLLCGEAL